MTKDNNTIEMVKPPKLWQLVRSCFVLAISILVALPAFIWFGYSNHGYIGIVAAAIAALVCWGASTSALVLTQIMQRRNSAVAGMFLAMLVRTGLPFAVGVVFGQIVDGPLAQAGFFGMILVYYFISLIVETVLAVFLNENPQTVH